MANTGRDDLRLRTITVTTRAAFRSVGTDTLAIRAVKVRSKELLADLERAIQADGADPRVLARIDDARRELD